MSRLREQLEVLEEHLGRRGQCTQCGRKFRIGTREAAERTPPAETRPSLFEEDLQPQIVTFPCSLCDTRITARRADVGRKVVCPDCGRPNVIPAPPKQQERRAPAALEGNQFELWGVDEAPTSRALAAATPRLHPVECRVCQTLMYATEKQIGSKLKCPDCGALTVVKASVPPKPIGHAIISGGDEYELDEASAPMARPMPQPIAIREAEHHAALRAQIVREAYPDSVRDELSHGRPKRPAVPLVQGVWRMLVTSEIIARWILLSLILAGAAWCAADALMGPAGGLGGFIGIALMVFAMLLGGIWVTMAAPTFLAILTESSDGHDRLNDPPQWTQFDWFADCGYVICAAAASGLPAMLAWTLGEALPIPARAAVTAGIVLLIFPAAMLSELMVSSPFAVVSGPLMASLRYCFGPWLLFYLLTALVAASVAGAGVGLGMAVGAGVVAAPCLVMAGLLIYARLLGRLAWWVAETMPMNDHDKDDDA